MNNQFKQKLTKILSFLSAFFIVYFPLISFSQTTIMNPLGSDFTSIPVLVSTFLGYVVRIGGVVAIFAFIYSGYRFVKARGNEKELGDAKNIFYGTVIGVAVLLGAQIIANIVVGTINTLR